MTKVSKNRILIDLESGQVHVRGATEDMVYGIGTPEAFSVISRAWLRSGWDNKYVYGFSWLGRPLIQLPEDMMRMQEVIHRVRPDVIIETGVAHGGSLVFYASLCKALDHGRVIGVEVEIRPQNRVAIEQHPLSSLITLIEGNSIEAATIKKVKDEIGSAKSILVLLDSCHTKEHVVSELKAYAPLVTPGSYIVAMDGIMEEVVGAPRTQADWTWNNPRQAALEFVEGNPDFRIEEPEFAFNEGFIKQRVTYWPSAFITRLIKEVPKSREA
jgi:cephalosporin hydroxylase